MKGWYYCWFDRNSGEKRKREKKREKEREKERERESYIGNNFF